MATLTRAIFAKFLYFDCCSFLQFDKAENKAAPMNTPSAGWKRGIQNGNQASNKDVSSVSCFWKTPTTNHARIARMKKKSATKNLSNAALASPYWLEEVVSSIDVPACNPKFDRIYTNSQTYMIPLHMKTVYYLFNNVRV